MSDVTIHFRDGTKTKLEDHGRSGGSYSQKVRYEGAFFVVIDCYEKQTAFPADLIQRVEVSAPPDRW